MSLNVSLPVISIVIPMYNRAHFIARAINSCLQQDFQNFEIVCVDDGSTDKTVDVVKEMADPRIVLFYHEKNQGIGPTRNAGMHNARGAWIILLDSDDELLPGALEIINRAILNSESNISRIVFMYKLDTGGTSPSPALDDGIWDYAAYINWTANHRERSDYLNVIKSSSIMNVRFPDNRADVALYQFDFAYHYLTETRADIVGIIHTDADNRMLKPTPKQLLESADASIVQTVDLLKKHGVAMKNISPPLYYEYIRGLITLYFISGQRRMGLRYFFQYFPYNPLQKKLWAVVLLGLIGKKYLAWLKAAMSS